MDVDELINFDSHSYLNEFKQSAHEITQTNFTHAISYAFEYLKSCSVTFAEFVKLTQNVTQATADKMEELGKKLRSSAHSNAFIGVYPSGPKGLQKYLESLYPHIFYPIENHTYSNVFSLVYDFFFACNVLYPVGNPTTAHIFVCQQPFSSTAIASFNNEYSYLQLSDFLTRYYQFMDHMIALNNNKANQSLNRYILTINSMKESLKELSSAPTQVVEFTNPYSWT